MKAVIFCIPVVILALNIILRLKIAEALTNAKKNRINTNRKEILKKCIEIDTFFVVFTIIILYFGISLDYLKLSIVISFVIFLFVLFKMKLRTKQITETLEIARFDPEKELESFELRRERKYNNLLSFSILICVITVFICTFVALFEVMLYIFMTLKDLI